MGNQIEIFRTENNQTEIQVLFENDSVWLDAHTIASLFSVNRPAIVKHIQNIYKSEELVEFSTCSILEQVAADGKLRKMKLYNLDMILSVGYRVKLFYENNCEKILRLFNETIIFEIYVPPKNLNKKDVSSK
jgi:hypothetical protein